MDLMRAICQHDGYLVPLAYASGAMNRNQTHHVTLLDRKGRAPAGALWIFTDAARADACAPHARASGWPLGPYTGPLRGFEILAALDDTIAEVRIDPGAPDGLCLGRDAIPYARAWARAIAAEQAIRERYEPGGEERLHAALRASGTFFVLMTPEGEVSSAQAGGFGRAAFVFTAPDCVERARGAFAGTSLEVDARAIFTTLPRLGVDGLIVNPQGPGPTMLAPAAFCDEVAQGWV